VRAVLLLAIGALALAGCQRGYGRPPEPNDQAVARVEGQTIWASDVRRAALAQGLIGEGEALPAGSPEFARLLRQIADQKLLAAEALQRRLDRSPEGQRRLAAARERVLSDLLVEEVVDKAVNEQAVRRLYQEQVRLSTPPEQLRLRQIVSGTAEEAQRVRRELAAGADFARLAGERSGDAETRHAGGDLGYVTLDALPPPYRSAVQSAPAGAVVGPFPAQGGYVVAKVEDRRAGKPPSFAEARPQIVRFLTYDEVRDQVARLRERGKVQFLIPMPRAATPAVAPPPPVAAAPRAPGASGSAAEPLYIPPGGVRPASPTEAKR
jgi:peptidyl-prolyl cis-trans isomerase C